MSVSVNSGALNGGYLKITLTGGAAVTDGGLGAVLNPEGVDLGITRAWIKGRTGSTGAANLDAGVGATATTKGTDICSAMDVVEATLNTDLTFLPAVQVAETDNPCAIWGAGQYITFTGSADTTGLDADIYIEYIRLA